MNRVQKFVRVLLILFGAMLGPGLIALFFYLCPLLGMRDPYQTLLGWAVLIIFGVSAIIGGVLFYFAAPAIIKYIWKCTYAIEKRLQEIPTSDMVVGFIGLILGFILAALLTHLFSSLRIAFLVLPISILIYAVCGYLCVALLLRRREEIAAFFQRRRSGEGNEKKERETSLPNDKVAPKILDTSVIIDGRIFDICQCGFLEGDLIVPEFVLQEMQRIADSADALKRNRGRRGLDMLTRMRKELGTAVVVDSQDYDDIAEVDAKLLRLARERGGKVVTNDYNLNKVAAVQGVPVLNINELSNAVKPVALPGEEMYVMIVKEGKEAGQGVAYLDDGTMVVVDGGRRLVGEMVHILVTSVLQTSAGRMIFGRLNAE